MALFILSIAIAIATTPLYFLLLFGDPSNTPPESAETPKDEQ